MSAQTARRLGWLAFGLTVLAVVWSAALIAAALALPAALATCGVCAATPYPVPATT